MVGKRKYLEPLFEGPFAEEKSSQTWIWLNQRKKDLKIFQRSESHGRNVEKDSP